MYFSTVLFPTVFFNTINMVWACTRKISKIDVLIDQMERSYQIGHKRVSLCVQACTSRWQLACMGEATDSSCAGKIGISHWYPTGTDFKNHYLWFHE